MNNKLPVRFHKNREYTFMFMKDLKDSQPVLYHIKDSENYVEAWLQVFYLEELATLQGRSWFVLIERNPSTHETRSMVGYAHINVEISGARDFKK